MKSEMNISGKGNMSKDLKQEMADCDCVVWFDLVRGQSAKRAVVKVEDWRQIVKPDFRKQLFCLKNLAFILAMGSH